MPIEKQDTKAITSPKWMVTDLGDNKIATSGGVLGDSNTQLSSDLYVPLYASGAVIELTEEIADIYRERGWITSVKNI